VGKDGSLFIFGFLLEVLGLKVFKDLGVVNRGRVYNLVYYRVSVF
jgi:hypothetical protein